MFNASIVGGNGLGKLNDGEEFVFHFDADCLAVL